MSEKGQTTLEFTIVASLVLLPLLFAIIDLAMMFYVNLTMQHAVREGARYVVTGQTGNYPDLKTALIQKIYSSSNGLYDQNALDNKNPTVSVLTPTSTGTFSNYTGEQVTDTGQPDQIIIVRLVYSWPLFTPLLYPFFTDGRYTFTASATMRNEQWGK